MESRHIFDTALAIDAEATGLAAETHPAFANMNGPLGGWTAALMMKAVVTHKQCAGDPVAFTVNLCAPIAEGRIGLDVQLIRAGKRTRHWNVVAKQGGTNVASASVVMAHRQESWSHSVAVMEEATPFETTPRFDPPVDLPWLDRFQFRFMEGELDPSPHQSGELRSARSRLWLAFEPPRAIDFVALTALSDVFFLRCLHVRGARGPMGTVTMTTYFHCSAQDLERMAIDKVIGVADARIFTKNFHDQVCELWSPEGVLLATGTQMSWFKE